MDGQTDRERKRQKEIGSLKLSNYRVMSSEVSDILFLELSSSFHTYG